MTSSLPRPRNTDRLFLALLPDAAALAQLVAMRQALHGALGLTGSMQAPERLHVTLHFLGDHPGLPQPLVDAVGEVVAAAGREQRAFSLTFDRVGSFPGQRARRPFVLRGADALGELLAFQCALGSALSAAALPHTPADAYTPHVTLLYDPQQVPLRSVAPPVTWTAHDFVLVRSRIGRASHDVIARWGFREN